MPRKKIQSIEIAKQPPAVEGEIKETRMGTTVASPKKLENKVAKQQTETKITWGTSATGPLEKLGKNATPEEKMEKHLELVDYNKTDKSEWSSFKIRVSENTVEVHGDHAKITDEAGTTTNYDLNNKDERTTFNNKLKELDIYEKFYREFGNWLTKQQTVAVDQAKKYADVYAEDFKAEHVMENTPESASNPACLGVGEFDSVFCCLGGF